MRKHKKLVFIAAILIVITLFSGCGLNSMELVEDDSVREDAENIIEAIEAKDSDYIYDTYFNNDFIFIEKDEFDEGIAEIYSVYKGQNVSVKLYGINIYTNNSDGESSSTKVVTYLVNTSESIYTMTLTYLKDSNNEYILVGANVSEFLNYVINSSFFNYSILNWILLAFNIISYGIMITALILCIKTKIKNKALWIILILLQVGITLTHFPYKHSVYFSFIKILGASKYLLYAHGGTVTSVFFHIFAVVFLFVRKSLNRRYLDRQEIARINAQNQQMTSKQTNYNNPPIVIENQETEQEAKLSDNEKDR